MKDVVDWWEVLIGTAPTGVCFIWVFHGGFGIKKKEGRAKGE